MAATTGARRRQIRVIQAIFAGIATVAMLVLFHNAQLGDANNVGALGSVRLVDRVTFAADGDDDEAQLQQQLAQQQMQLDEQQAEEQEQLANQEAQQAEQQATMSVP